MSRDNNPPTNKSNSDIQCLEVLIPKRLLHSSHNLQWTLSVYSLENRPVTKNHPIHHFEIFHFMVYDWKRTIKEFLENHQIDYSITQYFTPDTLYTDAEQEQSIIAAITSTPDAADEITDDFLFREGKELVLDTNSR